MLNYSIVDIVNYVNQWDGSPQVTFGFIVAGIFMLVKVVGMWMVFDKMGEPGWKSLIPYYNTYTLFYNCWKTSIFPWYLAVVVLENVIDSGLNGTMLGAVLSIPVSIVGVVIAVELAVNVSRAFGKGNGFAVGLFFLAPIFYTILGYGQAEYQGNDYNHMR